MSDLSSHALAPGTQIRDYTIGSVIGVGGFSIVYKALDNALQREVAIKEYFPGSLALRDTEGGVHPHSRDAATFSKGIESFLNEGKLLAAFDHPALLRVYRCWEERGTAYLAMRLYTGITLRDAVLAGEWHADAENLHALLAPLCDALDLLHASHCYHRDVAPDNIMLVDVGARVVPVLLDFGAARKAIESTQVFTAILKPGYAPIEQYGDGELKQGPWTDIYALAGVVHFMLAGNAPPTAISRMIRDAMPRPRDAFVGRLPERSLDAIEAALAVKPEARPQSISEFVALFGWDTMAESLTTVVLPPMPVPLPDVAPDAAVTTLVDERTVVVPLPQKLAPAMPVVASPEPAMLTDDDRTVVMPRRDLDVQIAAKKKAVTVPAPTAQPAATGNKSRSVIWIAAAAGLIAVAALTWKLTSTPAVTPITTSTPDTKLIAPVDARAQPGNDTSGDKKTSLPIEAPPKPVINVPDTITITPAPVTTPPPNVITEPPKTAVTESPTASASAAKAKAAAKEKAKASRATAASAEDGADKPPARRSLRPARCEVLIERFGLGETVSAADQRFFQESCK